MPQVTHMPPELLSNGLLFKAVDMYAFGVIMWELCVPLRLETLACRIRF